MDTHVFETRHTAGIDDCPEHSARKHLKRTFGAGTGDPTETSVQPDTARNTVNLLVAFVVPPAPVQVNVNGIEPISCERKVSVPLIGRSPLHAPLAIHFVASVADH